MTVGVGAFGGGEVLHVRGGGEVVVELLGLGLRRRPVAGEEQVVARRADQYRAADALGDPVAQVVVQVGGEELP
ncbi:hypothetical protein ACWDR3_11395 [Streptomyces sp. NPDC001002]